MDAEVPLDMPLVVSPLFKSDLDSNSKLPGGWSFTPRAVQVVGQHLDPGDRVVFVVGDGAAIAGDPVAAARAVIADNRQRRCGPVLVTQSTSSVVPASRFL